MRRLLWLVLLALPVVGILTLPAALVPRMVDPPAGLGDWHGSVWSGHARWRQAGFPPLDVRFHYRLPRHWHWQASGGETRLRGVLVPTSGGYRLDGVTGHLAPDRLDLHQWLPDTRADGSFHFDGVRVRGRSGQPPTLGGLMVWQDAALAGRVNARLGRVEVRFDPPADANGDPALATFRSLEPADVELAGRVTRSGDSYHLQARLQAAADRPELARALARLGRPAADGGVIVEYRGPLGW